MIEGVSDRFVVELLKDGVEKARCSAVCRHNGAAAEGCHPGRRRSNKKRREVESVISVLSLGYLTSRPVQNVVFPQYWLCFMSSWSL